MKATLLLYLLKVIIVAINNVEGAEVLVDESGNTHEQEKDYLVGYNFGPTSRESLELKSWSVLKQLFPNTPQTLADAWEKHPLYVPSSPSTPSINEQEIATLLPTVSADADHEIPSDRFSKLFAIDDSLKVLSDPSLIHRQDYFVLKYLIRDGEEWNGQLPDEKVPLQHIPVYLQHQEFSLVINNLQRRWNPVKNFARSLEMEINSHAVVCNVYITPPKSSRAFESHIDWMDVIVLQLSGEKVWSVWDTPFVKLVPPDQKRKPMMKELYKKKFENVRMKPGDLLYLPRGTMHNATTPSDSNEMSLHLTFGIQYDFYATMESLIHHAALLFRTENKSSKSIAVKSRLCGGTSLTYDKLLHFSISEIIRRTNCGGFGEPEETFNNDDYQEAICNLRKSVPLHPEWKELDGRSDVNVEDEYVRGLEAILDQVSVANTLNFVNFLSQPDGGATALGTNPFTYIGMKENQKYQCRLEQNEIDDLQKEFEKFTSTFLGFAKNVFTESRQDLISKIESDRLARWQQEDALLTHLYGSV